MVSENSKETIKFSKNSKLNQPLKDEISQKQKVRKRQINENEKTDEDCSKRLRLDNASNIHVGTILALGQGDMGQLGLGEDILVRKKPAIVKDLAEVEIKKIVAGALHTICVTSKDQIFSFGCNDEFALGRETDEEDGAENLPRPISFSLSGHKITQVTAGDSHTMILTSEGKVFIWGTFRDSHGKLGMFEEEEVCKSPTLMKSLNEPVVSIASGNDHIIMVSFHGKVFSMGCCEQGQLGRVARYFADRKNQRRNATHSNILLRPLRVSLPRHRRNPSSQQIIRAFAGAFTSWVLTNDDVIFAWGLNNWNQLGFPDNENRYRPEQCPSLSKMNIRHIAGGQHHTLVLDQTGRVYCMGRGDYGRLGLGVHIKQADKLMRIDQLEDIASISACSAVSFAVDSKGVAYGWGLGSNLQLTTGEEEDEWTPVPLSGKNLENRKVLDVSAGGQHTVVLAGPSDASS